MAECPTCGEEFEKTHGMKVHHVRVHGESIAGVEVECAQCGKVERRIPAQARRVENTFCSGECRGAWQSENWQNQDHPNWKRVDVECDYCGETNQRKASELDFERFFCNRRCQAAWQSENRLSGEDHPLWSDEAPSHAICYGLGWNEAKKAAVRKRDGYACQSCGLDNSENQGRFGTKLHVHHIQPAREFEDPRERNAMDNLISLCSRCHPVWEKMSPLTPLT